MEAGGQRRTLTNHRRGHNTAPQKERRNPLNLPGHSPRVSRAAGKKSADKATPAKTERNLFLHMEWSMRPKPVVPLAYSVDEALAKLGIGRDFFYRLIREKRLPARKLGKRTLILASDLDAFLEALPRMHGDDGWPDWPASDRSAAA